MPNLIKSAALSFTLLLGSFAAMPAAQADAPRITVTTETVQYRADRDNRHHRDMRRDHRHGDRHQSRRACTPDRALEKASRMGLNRVRVANVNRNTISVRGSQRGYATRITFARAPNCPVIR